MIQVSGTGRGSGHGEMLHFGRGCGWGVSKISYSLETSLTGPLPPIINCQFHITYKNIFIYHEQQ